MDRSEEAKTLKWVRKEITEEMYRIEKEAIREPEMTEKIALIQHDFDNMENREAHREKILNVFVDTPDCNCYSQASDYLSKLKPPKLYLGWDEKIYPNFEYRKVYQ